MLQVIELRCEYKRNPLGIEVKRPRISWKLKSEARSIVQSAYEIEVAESADFDSAIWGSGKIQSEQSLHVELGDLEVASQALSLPRQSVERKRRSFGMVGGGLVRDGHSG